MCRPSENQKVTFDLIHVEKGRNPRSTMSQPTIACGIALSTVAYLVQIETNSTADPLAGMGSARSVIPYLMFFGCILNWRRRSLALAIDWLSRRLLSWKATAEQSALSSSGLASLEEGSNEERLARALGCMDEANCVKAGLPEDEKICPT